MVRYNFIALKKLCAYCSIRDQTVIKDSNALLHVLKINLKTISVVTNLKIIATVI